MMATLSEVYGLPLRATRSLLRSVVGLLGLSLPVPCYKTLCRWKVRRYGWSKRRTWRKLHVGVDEATGEVVAAAMTTECVRRRAGVAGAAGAGRGSRQAGDGGRRL